MFLQKSGQNILTYFLAYSFHFVKIKLAQLKIGRQDKISFFALSPKRSLLSTLQVLSHSNCEGSEFRLYHVTMK